MVAATLNRRPLPTQPAGPVCGSHVVTAGGRQISCESLESLERLDDTVFAALSGDAAALEELRKLWRETSHAVDADVLDETRRHYVDRAQSRWRRSQESHSERLTLGFAALEVLALFGE